MTPLKYLLLPFILLSLSLSSIAQFTLTGKVIDDDTGESIPYAYLVFPSKSIGITSNEEGYFYLSSSDLSLSDSIVVSSIGYQTYRGRVGDILKLKDKSERGLSIMLSPDPIELGDLEFSSKRLGFDLDELMEEVLNKYKEDKRETPHIARAFVRERAKLEEKYIMFSEALGYSVFLGVNNDWAARANHQFYAEHMRKCSPTIEWKSFQEHAKTTGRYDDVIYGGSNTLNTYRSIEINGILSNQKNNYSYSLERSYSEGSQKVFVINFKSIISHGTIEVYGNSYHIKSVACTGDFIWSPAYHKRLRGNIKIFFNYYEGKPFVREITTYYSKKNLEHWNYFYVVVQKYDEFDVSHDDISKMVTISNDPFVKYVPSKWDSFEVPNPVDLKEVEKDLGHGSINELFRKNSGKQYLGGEMKKYSHEAQIYIESLMHLF